MSASLCTAAHTSSAAVGADARRPLPGAARQRQTARTTSLVVSPRTASAWAHTSYSIRSYASVRAARLSLTSTVSQYG